MRKILITGSRKYGLCEAMCNLFDTTPDIEYETASRSNGYHLDTAEGGENLQNIISKVNLISLLITLPFGSFNKL